MTDCNPQAAIRVGTHYREETVPENTPTGRYRGAAAKALPKGTTPAKKSRSAKSSSRRQKSRTTKQSDHGSATNKRSSSKSAKPSNRPQFDPVRLEQLRQSSVELIGYDAFMAMAKRRSTREYRDHDGVPDMLANRFGETYRHSYDLAKAVLDAQRAEDKRRHQERDEARRRRRRDAKPQVVRRQKSQMKRAA